jgi:hypothetical protein
MGRALPIALALAAILAPARGRAEEPRLEAEVDRTELAQDEVLTLEIRLEASEAPSALQLAETDAFEVVSRAQSRQTSFSLGGGVKVTQVVVTRLGLAPKRTGALTVPAAFAVVGGKRYETKPIPVTVLPAGAGASRTPPGSAPGGQAFRGWEKDLVLDVELDRSEVFLGEQVTASIWLFSPLGVVEYEAFTPPRYEGFWAEELETPRTLQFQVKQRNGVPTRAYLLQRVALFPTRAGTLTLSPAELAVAVRLGGSSPFDPFPDVRRLRRRSAPVSLEVKPLPAGAPPGFESVNVGCFTLETSLSEPRVPAGQPVTVRITAAGEGNVRALALPRLPAIAGARPFDPTSSEKAAPKSGRFGGSRTQETVLVPERTGELVIPPLSWPYFDPRTARYEVARTSELRVAVGPGATGEPAASGTNALAAGLRPIRADASLARPSPPPWRSPLFAALLALPPLAFAGLALADRLRARAGANTARRLQAAARTARRRLATARRHLARGDPGFIAEVDRALTGYAADRLCRPAAGLTREALGAALAEAGAPPRAVRALLATLDQGDSARYGAGASGEELVLAAERALALLEEAEWAEGSPASAAGTRTGGEG